MNKVWLVTWVIIILLLGLLISQINRNPNYIPSARINKPISNMQLKILNYNKKTSITKLFPKQVKIVHFWATWCMTCQIEHEHLLKITKKTKIPWIGIAYKDDASKITKWLYRLGNPYQHVLLDPLGDLAISMGVYGTPETFLISADNKIILRYEGMLNETVWETQILPYINKES